MTGACARKRTHGAHAQHAVINKAMSADMALPPPAAPFDLHPEALFLPAAPADEARRQVGQG